MKTNAIRKSEQQTEAVAHETLVSALDYDRLTKHIHEISFSFLGHSSAEKPLINLKRKLDRSDVVDPEDVPGDIVTMNSTVAVLEMGSTEATTYTIVYPDQTDIDNNRISVLSPIGCSLFGFRVNDIVEIKLPYGNKKVRIQDLPYQPERAGNYEL